jgi:hypothetical protein
MISFDVSEKKIVLSRASKSIPRKKEGLPVTGTMTSSWVERVNGIPRTADWDEKIRKFFTTVGRVTQHSQPWPALALPKFPRNPL